MANPSPSQLIASLLQPEAYPHSVQEIQVRETHISWVLLAGEVAYKIKKPVDLGFADFTTLERRRHFCNEEVRLNRRFAADLYLGIVPITAEEGRLAINGLGDPVEYAVLMRQFDEHQLATTLLNEGKIQPAQIDELAEVIAALHETASCVGLQTWGSASQVREPVIDNFTGLRPLLDEPPRLRQLDELKHWSLETHQRLAATFEQRHTQGFVRECHGDLHLGNIVQWHGAMTPFDCIEFNPRFRWIDVMNEVAFLVMDLEDHGRSDLAWRFLNTYLEHTGDYGGLSVLPFYLVYRAIVRAKVDALRLHQSGLETVEQQRLSTEWHGYLDLASRYTQQRETSLTITHGLSGSGKSTGTQALIERGRAIRVRSDVERKRLHGRKFSQSAADAIGTGIYSELASEQTYDRLAALTQSVISDGFPVLVDATFLRRAQRQRFRQLASDLGVPFHILEFHTDEQTLKERILSRMNNGHDVSDATVDVLEHQLRTDEPLTRDEQAWITSPAAPGRAPESRSDS